MWFGTFRRHRQAVILHNNTTMGWIQSRACHSNVALEITKRQERNTF